jgi:diguanylate cyclase (GGDEF)-like protein
MSSSIQMLTLPRFTKPALYSRQLRTRYWAFFVCLINCLDYLSRVRGCFCNNAVPLVTVGVALTNHQHHWLWTITEIKSDGFLQDGVYELAWFNQLVSLPYSYLNLVVASLLLARAFFTTHRAYRNQLITFSLAGLTPFAGSLIFLLGYAPFDTTLIGFGIASILMAWSLYRHELLADLPLPYRQVFDHIHEAVVLFDQQDRLLDFNTSARAYFGVSEVMLKQPLRFSFLPELKKLGTLETQVGSRQLSFHLKVFGSNDTARGYLFTASDISEQKKMQEQLLEGALLYDSLTALPNRTLFLDRLQQAVARSARGQHEFAVLFLDLDRFKVINDSLGHTIGDRLLAQVAERLKNCVRPQDTVARLGGDEFAILLEETLEAEASLIAERIQQTLKAPFSIESRTVSATTSIGITLSRDIHDPEELLRHADVAMYHAKNLGGSRFAVFDTIMHEKALEKMQLEVSLRQALDRNEFRVHYQPILNLQTREVSGFEALLRWYHPEKGLIPPVQFIPIAEAMGIIHQLDMWILKEASQQLYKWQQHFGLPLTISTNLSVTNFGVTNLSETILETLKTTGLSTQHLKLEITESTLMENLESVLEQLTVLRDAGVSLQIDDFGTGYSSLSYLHKLPLDSLKIDRSFVNQLDQDKEIVRTIISLARSLNLSVVAEGIETEGQLEVLEFLNCDYGQGFLFSRPLPANEIEILLRRQSLVCPVIEARAEIYS